METHHWESWRRSIETSLGVSCETYLRRHWDVQGDVAAMSLRRLNAAWVVFSTLEKVIPKHIFVCLCQKRWLKYYNRILLVFFDFEFGLFDLFEFFICTVVTKSKKETYPAFWVVTEHLLSRHGIVLMIMFMKLAITVR